MADSVERQPAWWARALQYPFKPTDDDAAATEAEAATSAALIDEMYDGDDAVYGDEGGSSAEIHKAIDTIARGVKKASRVRVARALRWTAGALAHSFGPSTALAAMRIGGAEAVAAAGAAVGLPVPPMLATQAVVMLTSSLNVLNHSNVAKAEKTKKIIAAGTAGFNLLVMMGAVPTTTEIVGLAGITAVSAASAIPFAYVTESLGIDTAEWLWGKDTPVNDIVMDMLRRGGAPAWVLEQVPAVIAGDPLVGELNRGFEVAGEAVNTARDTAAAALAGGVRGAALHARSKVAAALGNEMGNTIGSEVVAPIANALIQVKAAAAVKTTAAAALRLSKKAAWNGAAVGLKFMVQGARFAASKFAG